MGESIFINYRRGEDQAAAGRLYDQLEATFTRERIFIDVDNIAPGRDFTEELATRVEQCDVFLAVIGRRWADVVDVDGSRRLDNPNDWVRVEIESAQRLGKHIIPVLVDGAEMPRPEKLPDALQRFARRNAARLTHERFRADVQALVVAIGRLREAERAQFELERRQTPRGAETPAISTRSAREAASPVAAGRRLAPMAIAALAALAVIAAGAGVLVWRLSSPSAVATDSIAKRADGAPSIANPMSTKIAAAPTSTPTAATEPTAPAASPDASPSLEAKVKTDQARPTPSAAPTVVASAAPVAPPTIPLATASPVAPLSREAKVKIEEAQPTPSAAPTVVVSSAPTLEPTPTISAAPSAAPVAPPTIPLATASPDATPLEAKPKAIEAQPTPSAAPTVVVSAAPTLEPTPTASAASAPSLSPSPAATATAKAPPALETKVSAIEAQPTLSAAPAASPLATASPDAPPLREVEIKTDEAQPTPSAPPPKVFALPTAAAPVAVAPMLAASAPLTPVAASPTAAAASSEPQVALAAPAAKPTRTDLAALTPLVAAELRRLGCYSGAATGWDAVDLRLGVDKFAELAKLATLPAEPDVGLLAALKSEPDHFCAPQCSPREVASDGRCVPKTCGANQVLTHDGACVARQPKPQTTAAARAPAPAAGKRCFTFNGSSYCE
ncbi:MAG: TIR domain-containing protein [Roseiarcus sp.]|uniref:toll/interleukin-1 receptor domain-containing protein n=1 Tax=Roseiarcus sp. TaxID=1969460 RepID=UPI003C1E596A